MPLGDLRKMASFETATSMEMSNFDWFKSAIAYQRALASTRDQVPKEELVRNVATLFESKLAGYEAILSKHKFLAGEEVTLADLYHLPYGSKLAPQGFDWLENSSKFPNIARSDLS
jgi:glutathione S-transferase